MGRIYKILGFVAATYAFVFCAQAMGAKAKAAAKKKPLSCEQILKGRAFLGAQLPPDPVRIALTAQRQLTDLLSVDPDTGEIAENNLARQHPMVLLSAGQRILAMIQAAGSDEVHLKHHKNPLKKWNIFSVPSKINGGRIIIGQEKALEELVSSVKNFVYNDERLVPALVGPHGTGKSLFMDIFTHAMRYLSVHSEKHFMWTYDWKNLSAIRALRVLGDQPRRAELNDSPLALLPDALQNELLEALEDEAIRLGVGAPRGTLRPVPQNDYIARKILEHERARRIVTRLRAELEGAEIDPHIIAELQAKKAPLFAVSSDAPDEDPVWLLQNWSDYPSLQALQQQVDEPLSPLEEVQALSRYIDLRRLVLGEEGSGTLPTIDAQGGVNWDISLFVSRRIKLAALLGDENNPLMWGYGKVASGHGMAVKFDEYFRNPADFRDIMLRLSQDRKMEIRGAPSVALDMFILAAFNQTSLDKAREDDDSKAHIDRLNMINMLWSVYPHKIMKTMLFMKFFNQDGGENISVRALDDPKGKKQKAENLEALFPIWLEGEPLRITDGRYELWVGSGDQEVHISPHTLLYMASVAALTRVNLDPTKASEFKTTKVIRMPVYRDAYMRLNWLLGESDEVQARAGVTETLVELHHLLKEGNYGMSARDLSKWFNTALDIAREHPEGAKDLTPKLAYEAFISMVEQDKFEFNSNDDSASENEIRVAWLNYLTKVAMAKLVIPRLKKDMNTAQENSSAVQRRYIQALAMAMALNADNTAENYVEVKRGTKKKIDHKFLKELAKRYRKVSAGEELDYGQIASWVLTTGKSLREIANEEHGARHHHLEAAIRDYMSDLNRERVEDIDIANAIEHGNSDGNEASRLGLVILKNLQQKGYTEFGARELVNLVAQPENEISLLRDDKKASN